MRYAAPLAAVAASVIFGSRPALADGLYTRNSPVLQVDKKNYDRLIANSNHTSIIEFYAPWCGHCQNLKPAYEKAARSLAGLAKVAAVNCDEDTNKPFCGSMGVQGFPTLKIVRPGKKPGKPFVEDYQGARSAKAIVDSVVDKIPNHVKRVGDKTIDDWLSGSNETAKAILFTEKGTTSALLRALAIDFLGSISFAQIRDKEAKAVEIFGVSEYPKLLVLPGGDKDALVYDGEMKKEPMLTFLSQVASPNPDPPAQEAKAKKSAASGEKKKAKKDEAKKEEAKTTSTVTVEEAKPSASSDAADSEGTHKPIIIEDMPPMIPMLETELELNRGCLNAKAHTCILALLPSKADPEAALPIPALAALSSLGEISAKHAKRKSNLFPFFALPTTNTGASKLRSALSLADDSKVELIATNAKRSWYKRFSGSDFTKTAVENWIDAIRMGEGKKEKLPESVITDEVPVDSAKMEFKGSKVEFENAEAVEGLEIHLEEIVDEPSTEGATEAKATDEVHDEL